MKSLQRYESESKYGRFLLRLKYLNYICIDNLKLMGKLLSVLLALIVFLSSCEEGKVVAPAIEVESIVVNGDNLVDYKDSVDRMPVLKPGDEVEVRLYLDGNGSFLNSLNVTSDNPDVQAILLPSGDSAIAGDKNFTDLENGRMSFVDGVLSYEVKSRLQVVSSSANVVRLSFHLSARAECESGGIFELLLKTSN